MKVHWRGSPRTAYHAFEFRDLDGNGDIDLLVSDYATEVVFRCI